MKLRHPSRENRPGLARELLQVPEEQEAAWSRADIVRAVELLEHWKNHISATPLLVASLDLLAPGSVTPEQREEMVKFYLSRIQENLRAVDSGRTAHVNIWIFLLGELGSVLLIDPSARNRILRPEDIKRQVDPIVRDGEALAKSSSSPLLMGYALWEPEGRKLTQVGWEFLMVQAKRFWEAGGHSNNYGALQNLAVARVASPDRFSAFNLSPGIRQSIIKESRDGRSKHGNSYSFSASLFFSLILAAEEVKVTPTAGLQVQLPHTKLTEEVPLPERSAI